MKTIREVKCDHAIEEPKKHPAMEYVNIGNLIIGMCGTCYNALKGQILVDLLPDQLEAINRLNRVIDRVDKVLEAK